MSGLERRGLNVNRGGLRVNSQSEKFKGSKLIVECTKHLLRMRICRMAAAVSWGLEH